MDKGKIYLFLGMFSLPRVFTKSLDEMTDFVIYSSLVVPHPVKETLNFFYLYLFTKIYDLAFSLSENIEK